MCAFPAGPQAAGDVCVLNQGVIGHAGIGRQPGKALTQTFCEPFGQEAPQRQKTGMRTRQAIDDAADGLKHTDLINGQALQQAGLCADRMAHFDPPVFRTHGALAVWAGGGHREALSPGGELVRERSRAFDLIPGYLTVEGARGVTGRTGLVPADVQSLVDGVVEIDQEQLIPVDGTRSCRRIVVHSPHNSIVSARDDGGNDLELPGVTGALPIGEPIKLRSASPGP